MSKNSIEREHIEIHEIFDLIDELGDKALGDEWQYYPETDIYHKPEYVNPVAISYKIFKRNNTEDISARKPIYKDDDKENKQIIKGQMFDTIVQFSIWGKSYEEINNLREWFEKFVTRHLAVIKKAGVLKFLFESQLEDKVVEIKDNFFTVQRLHFFIRNKRLIKIPYSLIKDIDLETDVKDFNELRKSQIYY